MRDMAMLARDLDQVAAIVHRMQQQVQKLMDGLGTRAPVATSAPSGLLLKPRNQILAALGMHQKVSRAAWSHDRGDAIVFDAWQDHWEFDRSGNLKRYPMRTKAHYSPKKLQSDPQRGHTRWQHHVDMVLNGQRTAIAIVPMRSGSDDPNRRTRGWLPQYVAGEIVADADGQYWFEASQVVPI